MTNRHRDLSLDRSKEAWNCANDAQTALTALRESYKEYVTLVKNVPTSLLNNGLGQTLAFLNSKPNNHAYRKLFEHLQKWLAQEIYKSDETNPNIIELVQTGDLDRYRWAAKEAMEFITWLKLHSSSLDIKQISDDDSNQTTPVQTDGESAGAENLESENTDKTDAGVAEKSLEETE